jgi:hypothetical protein
MRRRGNNDPGDARSRRRRKRGPGALYRVLFQRPNGATTEGVFETSLPCLVNDLVPGVLRRVESDEIIFPFGGRVLERRAADPPYEALLVIEPTGLDMGKPFHALEDPPSHSQPSEPGL